MRMRGISQCETRWGFLALAPVMTMGLVQPVSAETRHVDVTPYIEVNQLVLSDIKGGNDDVLTYTTLAAGVDANVTTRRAEVGVSARYEHRFGWGDRLGDDDAISGIARARVNLVRDILSVEGGAIATRIRSGGYNGANGSLTGNVGNTSKVYSGYVGPTLATNVGGLDVAAAYRYGYTKVTDSAGFALPGVPVIRGFDQSQSHSITGSVGMRPGPLPIGWTLSGGYDRENLSQLSQHFRDKWARADVTLPVSPTVALIGGVGYEDIKISNRSALVDSNGFPVVTSGGRYVTDPASPRKLSYDQDGIIWDAGVLWRPSRRTSLQAQVGRRYGGMHYTGAFSWQPGERTSIGIVLFDSIDSFGRSLNGSLASLGTNFTVVRNPFSGDFNNCVFSTTGSGTCLNNALSGTSAVIFRNRGVAAQFATQQGMTRYGVAFGVAQRKFIADDSAILANVNGATDENYFGTITVSRKLDERSGIDANIYANYYDAGVAGNVDVLNAGAYAGYYRSFGRRLTATAAVGVDGTDPQGIDAIISAMGQVGLRYQF